MAAIENIIYLALGTRLLILGTVEISSLWDLKPINHFDQKNYVSSLLHFAY